MIRRRGTAVATASNAKILPPSAGTVLWGHGLAFVSVGTALALARTFLHFHLAPPFPAFAICAIGITFWYGGIWPGFLATLLATIVRYLPSISSSSPSLALRDLVFLIFALMMSMITQVRNELELRVAERTAELTRANEELTREIADHIRDSESLRQAQADLARISRITTLGELTASLAHEVNQPIAAAATNANTCLRWLARDEPDLEEAREAASRIVKDVTRASDIIGRVRVLFKKGSPQRELVDINGIIREMTLLLRNEANRYSISIRTEIASDLPTVMADPIQLQQVLMNLMLNGIDAMKDVSGGRELTLKTQHESDHLLISVSDTGVGLPAQANQIFDAFFTTKGQGTGMGLSISRSIIESHGGRLWAAGNSPGGARFCFTLPTDSGGK
jgi:C4-dicarboxylate-specific signal transduction histidine kinase